MFKMTLIWKSFAEKILFTNHERALRTHVNYFTAENLYIEVMNIAPSSCFVFDGGEIRQRYRVNHGKDLLLESFFHRVNTTIKQRNVKFSYYLIEFISFASRLLNWHAYSPNHNLITTKIIRKNLV